jgi:glutamate synthase (NADPH) small chain
MGKPTGFMEYQRINASHRPVDERVADYREINLPLSDEDINQQSARCMDCGIPFCHGLGCPLANRIPEFNDLVYQERWQRACEMLHATNNFPEITGRLCPAPCEAACTLNISNNPVSIKQIELEIVERGFAAGWITPLVPKKKTGKRVAVIGSGPAGLAAAQQIARAGHDVIVFEQDHQIGGLLRYGIPDFKLEKEIIDRRLEQMKTEGVEFQADVIVGKDLSLKYLHQQFDAICLTIGASQPRDLTATGRGLDSIHFAMEYLTQQNRVNSGEGLGSEKQITARDKVVVVIGGGDTGSDCVGTAIRQGAREVHQFEILPKPPEGADPKAPWPLWPTILKTSTSHAEGCNRRWSVLTKRFTGSDQRVSQLHGCEVTWTETNGKWKMAEVPDTDFQMDVDLVLLAMGFVHVVREGLVEKFALKCDPAGNLMVDEDYQTSEPGVFAAGDSVTGASLIVRAIATGRATAASINRYLKNR